jgi:hypothetical protein
MTFSIRSLFRRKQDQDLPPSYYLINPKPPQKRLTFGGLKLAAGVITGVIGVLAVGNQLYEGSKEAFVDVQLHQKYSGFELRVVNRGSAMATNIALDLASWPEGAPGHWTQTYSVRDLPPQSESSVHIELVTTELSEESRAQMLELMDRRATSGYVTVSCGGCPRARIWAFVVPGWRTPQDELLRNRNTTEWPLIELADLDHKPPTGVCVDYPAGACRESFAWKPGQ